MDRIKEPQKISRRGFLKGLGATLATGGAGMTAACGGDNEVTPTPVVLPDAPPVEVSLAATVTAMDKRDLDTSFTPEGKFTESVFEKVRQGTFLLSVNKVSNGTGWLAEVRGDTYYVVTNHHVVYGENDSSIGIPKEVILQRPGLENYFFLPKLVGVKALRDEESGMDLAVLKLQGEYFGSSPIRALPWRSDVQLDPEQKVLAVGFPENFYYDDGGSFKGRVMGEVVEAIYEEPQNREDDNLWVRGLINDGSSGGPVVDVENGEPVVIGVVSAKSFFATKNSNGTVQGQPIGVVSKLAPINELIAELDA